MKKKRADVLLYEHGHCESLEQAALLILEGKVRSGKDSLVHKASEMFPEDCVLMVDSPCSYVSRGAMKLKDAMERIAPDLYGLSAVDVGASTGGFTDLMLSLGAAKVYTVDVGKGLLHWKLRSDPRVICMEGVNAKEFTLPEQVDLVTMDVSFISALKVLPAADRALRENGRAFILVKPQFEAPKEDVPPGGVVTDDVVRKAALEKVVNFCTEQLHWSVVDLSESPLKGPKGNREWVAVFSKQR